MAYKVGWKRGDHWFYIVVTTKSEMLMEVADKTTISDKVSVKVLKGFKLKGEENDVG